MNLWQSLSREAIKERVFKALDENRNYDNDYILGIPGTYLDTEQFYRDADFLADAPFLRTFINNPNHIGCHTLTEEAGEDLFRGTQKLERETLRICAEEIMGAAPQSVDGYVAPGGTEANIQAAWIYRNYFQVEKGAQLSEIALLFSSDSHYSFHKACNILSIRPLVMPVEEESRAIDLIALRALLRQAQKEGLRYFILVANMSTTLFGSVDALAPLCDLLDEAALDYKVHVDGAFGGFIYPFTQPDNELNFANPRVNSITMDAHKMLMAPYGTGIFLIRKQWMHYSATQEAKYVQGLDYTLVGSRNGAQAIAIWMILQSHGPQGWRQSMANLIAETDKLCRALDELAIPYFRNPHLNIVSMRAERIPLEICHKYRLVSDNFASEAQWWKIVVMQHTVGKIVDQFIADMRQALP